MGKSYVIGAWAVLLVLGFAAPADAQGHSHNDAAGLPVENWPDSAAEAQLMRGLACACGQPKCGGQALSECTCEFAVAMRAEVKRKLKGRDLDDEAAKQRAFEEVREALVRKYGDDVLVNHRASGEAGEGPFWFPLALFAALIGAVLLRARRLVRQKRGASE